jgi:hypothetical protein
LLLGLLKCAVEVSGCLKPLLFLIVYPQIIDLLLRL